MDERSILREKMNEYQNQAAALLAKADLLAEIIHDIDQINPRQSSNQTISAIPEKAKFGGKHPSPQSIKIKSAAIQLLDDGVPRLVSVIRHAVEKELQIPKIPESTLRYILDNEPRIIKVEGQGYQLVSNEGAEASSN